MLSYACGFTYRILRFCFLVLNIMIMNFPNRCGILGTLALAVSSFWHFFKYLYLLVFSAFVFVSSFHFLIFFKEEEKKWVAVLQGISSVVAIRTLNPKLEETKWVKFSQLSWCPYDLIVSSWAIIWGFLRF